MSTVSIRIDEDLYKKARAMAPAQTRSIPQQIEHWAKIGRVAESNPGLTYQVIQDVLIGMAQEEAGEIEDYVLGEGVEG
jgi:predicted transcriptional regulator